VVEIYRDPVFGWRLDQARIAGNDPVPEPMRTAIVEELRALGVHVGRAAWELESALEEAHKPKFKLPSREAVVAGRFGEDED
jgi:hypothetical protein